MKEKIFFYLGITACALGAVSFGLSFTVLKIYALIGSVVLEIAALSFLATQKKKNNFKAVFYVKVISYALLFAFTAFFVGGLIYSAIN
ncbi:MAG: hypothetical protein HDP34_06025 [Clostridia bacterium]|nr:hypothetical protein [Clostridia bacterium]